VSSTDVGSSSSSDARTPVVVPRGRRPGGSSSLAIDRLILPLVERVSRGFISITASPGGGKTTAVKYLRKALTGFPLVRVFDSDELSGAQLYLDSSLVILISQFPHRPAKPLAVFELCAWTIDDCLEFLAARHRGQIAPVLKQLSNDPCLASLQGSPQLLSLVMDEMAAEASTKSILQVLRKLVMTLPIAPAVNHVAFHTCMQSLQGGLASSPYIDREPKVAQWLRHEAVQRVFAAEAIVEALAHGEIPTRLKNMGAKCVLPEIAAAIAQAPTALETLEDLIDRKPHHRAVPMAASIRLRVDPEWRPGNEARLNLCGAVLRSAKWTGIDLRRSRFNGADCRGADLSHSNLAEAELSDVNLAGANLHAARLDGAKLQKSNLLDANLTGATAIATDLSQADLTCADLTRAELSSAIFETSTLNRAVLAYAGLAKARLDRTEINGADFTGADLTEAKLTQVQMSAANWNHTCFRKARLFQCNLEGLEIESADFIEADLTASLLTATRFRNARFERACLMRTGLAEIEWENADLREANLAYASFHLGSSRSGLVGSTIPCEGSRTGFYTDEYYEQDYKSPEEIRKACLCGSDLRGAKLDHTDFYLVDLRGAKYTESQHKHFARCGAILVSRVN
jgi:uncharacterized protein YjbI with pentapeptide repeats